MKVIFDIVIGKGWDDVVIFYMSVNFDMVIIINDFYDFYWWIDNV